MLFFFTSLSNGDILSTAVQKAKQAFAFRDGADRYRSVVSSSLRQGPIGPAFRAGTASVKAPDKIEDLRWTIYDCKKSKNQK
jgi:hypothetical protein